MLAAYCAAVILGQVGVGQVTFLAATIAAAVSLVVAVVTNGISLLTAWGHRRDERSLARIERGHSWHVRDARPVPA